MITPTTLPYEDKGVAVWYFLGDKVVGLNAERKGGKYLGHLDAYSLNDAKFLWHLDTPSATRNQRSIPRATPTTTGIAGRSARGR